MIGPAMTKRDLIQKDGKETIQFPQAISGQPRERYAFALPDG